MIESIYWAGLFLLVYPYLIYPVLLKILSLNSVESGDWPEPASELPSLTLIISAYNEAAIIAKKLDNSLRLNYPEDKLEIMVISDASDDGTDEIVREYAQEDSRIRLLRQEERLGKTAGLNKGVPEARGEIIVFSDANAMYHPDALLELVKPFQNPRVGYVVGAALYNDPEAEAAESEGLYWKFELALKEMESTVSSVVGGDGAIYAIRKPLFWPLQPDDINDFVNPLQIVSEGYQGVFNPKAICYEDAANDFAKEFKRKRRIVNRSWRAVKRYLNRFNVMKHFTFLGMLFSHKVLRWFSAFIFLIFLAANLLLVAVRPNFWYWLTLLGALSFLALAWVGASLDKQKKEIPFYFYIPYYFVMVNWSAALGIIDEQRGIRYSVWSHIRSTEEEKS